MGTILVLFWGLMLKLSRLTDYAVAAMVRLGAAGGADTSPGIALAIGVPEPTVAKVLKVLAARGLIASSRGASGGYKLTRPLAEIAVLEVIVAIEGEIALVSCVEGHGSGCENQLCPVIGRWDPVNEAIRATLSGISLAAMAAPHFPGLSLGVTMNEGV